MFAAQLIRRLQAMADDEIARQSRRFFKTAPGQYGHGDVFLGIRVPQLRALLPDYRTLDLAEIERLLACPSHEARLLALLILVRRFQRATVAEQRLLYRYYLNHTHCVNNWDLVDASAPHIVGAHLCHRRRSMLYKLAVSPSLWERRIAIVATLHFIRRGDFDDTLRIAERLLREEEDLIHKSTGWMLREVGKRDSAAAGEFIARHGRSMPRTMLRYALECFPQPTRGRLLRESTPTSRAVGRMRSDARS